MLHLAAIAIAFSKESSAQTNYFELQNRDLSIGDTPIICYTDDTKPRISGYPEATLFSMDITAQICDSFDGCGSFNDYSGGPCVKQYGSFSQGNTSYIHLSRCDLYTNSTVFNSIGGGTYKHCSGHDDWFTAIAHFQLPTFLCAQSCNNDGRCAGFTSDGQVCITLALAAGGNAFFKIP